jgi:hypothetical protein
MAAYYKGHEIQVIAVRIPQTGCWTVSSWVIWNLANDCGTKMILHHSLDFGNPQQAMRVGVEFAIKWIADHKALP